MLKAMLDKVTIETQIASLPVDAPDSDSNRAIESGVLASKRRLVDSCMGSRLTFTVIAGLAPTTGVRTPGHPAWRSPL